MKFLFIDESPNVPRIRKGGDLGGARNGQNEHICHQKGEFMMNFNEKVDLVGKFLDIQSMYFSGYIWASFRRRKMEGAYLKHQIEDNSKLQEQQDNLVAIEAAGYFYIMNTAALVSYPKKSIPSSELLSYCRNLGYFPWNLRRIRKCFREKCNINNKLLVPLVTGCLKEE